MSKEYLECNDYKELVDFKEVIGVYINPKTAIGQETTKGIIHYFKNGQAYIIPAVPCENKADNQDINEEIEARCLILLSVQRALIGAVTSHFRAVFVDWDHQSGKIFIQLYFVLEQYTEVDNEEAESVAAEVVADFSNGCIETKLVVIDCSQQIPHFGKVCIFKRKE